MGIFGRILLIEDNANDIELTLAAMEELKLSNDIDIARDGEEALDYLLYRKKFENRKKRNPVFIILDLKIPKISGLELLRVIKSSTELKIIPTIVFSSSRVETDIKESYRLGVNAYVVKPIDLTSFLKAIHELGLFWAVLNETPRNW